MRKALFFLPFIILLSSGKIFGQVTVERYWAYSEHHTTKGGIQVTFPDTFKIEIKRNGDGTGTIAIIPVRQKITGYMTPFWAEQQCGDNGCKECIVCFFVKQNGVNVIAQIQMTDEITGKYINVLLNDGSQHKYGILHKTTLFSK